MVRWFCEIGAKQVSRYFVRKQRTFQHAITTEKLHLDSSCLFYLWSAIEDLVLDLWLQQLKMLQPKHISLHFDGVRVDKTVMGPDATEFCQECEKAIQESSGFPVQIKVKQLVGTDLEVPEDLLANGNCILQARLHGGGCCMFGGDRHSSGAIFQAQGPPYL